MKNIISFILSILLLVSSCCVAFATDYFVTSAGAGNGLTVSTPDSQADYEAGNAPFNALTSADTVYFLDAFSSTIDCNTSGGHTMNFNYPGRTAVVTQSGNSEVYCGSSASGVVIDGLVSDGHDSSVLGLLGCDNCEVKNCRISNFGTAGQNHDGIFFGNGSTGSVHDNEVWGGKSTGGTGIDTSGCAGAGCGGEGDDGSILVYVYNNYVHDTVGYAFSSSGDEGNQDTVYYFNNVAINALKHFFAYECGNYYYYYNYAKNGTTLNSGHSPYYFSGGTCATESLDIVMRGNVGECHNGLCNQILRWQSSQSTLDSDYNMMYHPTATSTFNKDGTTYNLANWRTQTSGDANSIYANPASNINGMPTAVDGKNIGPAIAGLSYDDTDYRGITRTAPYDLGAFEDATGLRIR
jgi:hypothetical protein